uniref:Uncharacterized protein n=1 Tax=Avena sativa TaxID=4498 RepID=A0ACD5TD80_AVESA
MYYTDLVLKGDMGLISLVAIIFGSFYMSSFLKKLKIRWNLTTDGQYTASSSAAYAAQFHCRIKQPQLQAVWKIRAEGKVKFFLWLLLQNRNWTAERPRARGLQHNDKCSLCDQEFETSAHLALLCPFAKEVWAQFQSSNPHAVSTAARSGSIRTWWKRVRRRERNEQPKKDITVSVYMIWHIWKERGRRIFQDKAVTAITLSGLIRDDIQQLLLGLGRRIMFTGL